MCLSFTSVRSNVGGLLIRPSNNASNDLASLSLVGPSYRCPLNHYRSDLVSTTECLNHVSPKRCCVSAPPLCSPKTLRHAFHQAIVASICNPLVSTLKSPCTIDTGRLLARAMLSERAFAWVITSLSIQIKTRGWFACCDVLHHAWCTWLWVKPCNITILILRQPSHPHLALYFSICFLNHPLFDKVLLCKTIRCVWVSNPTTRSAQCRTA